MNSVSFTSHLRETLAQTRSAIDAWAIAERNKVDEQVLVARKDLLKRQKDIDTESAKLLALQLQHGCTVGDNDKENNKSDSVLSNERAELEEKVQKQTTMNQRLESQIEQLKKELEDLQIERDHIKQRVIATQQDAKSVADAKDISENDLTRGIVYYNYLGLKFQKAESDCLRFTFTQLNPNNPDQEYSFCLGVTNDDSEYVVVNCEPIDLSDEVLNDLVRSLNENDDMISFTRGMRKAFRSQITSQD